MMMGTYFMGKAPFADVYLHAMVRDSQGRKMSKSLGNTIDPLDVIRGINLDDLVAKTKTYPVPEKMLPTVISGLKKEFPEGILASGADGLRFTLVSMSGQGRAIKLSIPRVAGYRAFLNKIWNATRFALMNVGDEPVQPIDAVRGDLSWADRWILSRLQRVTERANTGLKTYHFHETADGMYHFFWDEFCDWYIELIKGTVAPGAPEGPREATRSVLMHVIDQSMRLLHPLCPFQTEEIWQKLPGRDQRWPNHAFCAGAPYPEVDAEWIDEEAEFRIGQVQETLTLIRNARHESGLPMQQKVPAVVITDDAALNSVLSDYDAEFKRLAKVTALDIHTRGAFEIPEQAAVNSGSVMDVVVLLDGLIDFAAERERLTKEIAKIDKVRQNIAKRLGNPGFRAKAPAHVIEESEAKLAEFNAQIERLEERLASIPKG